MDKDTTRMETIGPKVKIVVDFIDEDIDEVVTSGCVYHDENDVND